ncbi:histidine kinase [Luteitalea sp. TBR-22]|uniref:XrtA/PEP-CTERM system histidine kinase PrsK n=1 Tax=Luteitalea sp. TBR-22 TaxID=2802971 RepID=UPI001AFACF1E|nr:XrtA/PEP-CTERM system histidine kinase PrsK [Luteitalea sp. TBR-22]BCS36057.1 histidine kinase [Luteitalea sp. TBR-22]
MPLILLLPFGAALLAALLASASLVRKAPTVASWCFATGMLLLAADSACGGLALTAATDEALAQWLRLGVIVKSAIPVVWLGFSLTYSRGDWRESVHRWRHALALFGALPVLTLLVAFTVPSALLDVLRVGEDGDILVLRPGPLGQVLNAVLLVGSVLVLTNLEQTFRAAVGTARWRLKLVVIGLAVLFGARIYVRSQSILFSAHGLDLLGVEASGLLVGCAILALAYLRTGLSEVDIYPSRAVLRSSLTVLIVGTYLLVVGVLAQAVRRFGGAESFQVQALVLLIGMAGLAVLLLSDRLRQGIQVFVGRHFARAQHDSVKVWTQLSQALGTARDRTGVCTAACRLVSTTFEVLSVSLWLVDGSGDRLELAASTTPRQAAPMRLPTALRGLVTPLDIEALRDEWAAEWRHANPSTFPQGGHRWVVPLREGQITLGAIVLADRVNGAPYSREALDLLQCIGDQVASALQNLRLGDELAESRELEAFRTMSTFFVHDLKNAAASLNLMLKNLPVHFDDPEFRADALRGIANTASRIETMIARLGALRDHPATTRRTFPVDALVREAIDRAGPLPGVSLSTELDDAGAIHADRDQLASVITNLVLNARDAVAGQGQIRVRTTRSDGWASVSVQDDGCGMSEAFMRESLFKPFRSTKSKGLGVGMFQARMVVEAHGGQIHVESEEGRGTTVRLQLPAQDA